MANLKSFFLYFVGLFFTVTLHSLFPSELDLVSINNDEGVKLIGDLNSDFRFGHSVDMVGDFNGDNIPDMVVGSNHFSEYYDEYEEEWIVTRHRGRVYVLFGSSKSFENNITLSDLKPSQGFYIDGLNTESSLGYVVSGLDDMNGDGLDEIAISGFDSRIYIVFGSSTSMDISFDLSSLNGINGFSISGVGISTGISISGAGDFNNDGFNDLIIGNYRHNSYDGIAYVIYGSNLTYEVVLDASILNGTNGFTMPTTCPIGEVFCNLGASVANIGDFNGDGITDIGVSATNAEIGSVHTVTDPGVVYIIYGSNTTVPAVVDLSSYLTIDKGVALTNNTDSYGSMGHKISSIGDFNGDGLDDVLITSRANKSYIFFGTNNPLPPILLLDDLDGDDGFYFLQNGFEASRGIGDINNDGYDDLAINDRDGFDAFKTYVIFGKNILKNNSFTEADLDGDFGFTIINSMDELGFRGNIGGGFDINGDEVDDLVIGAEHMNQGASDNQGGGYIIYGKKGDSIFVDGFE